MKAQAPGPPPPPPPPLPPQPEEVLQAPKATTSAERRTVAFKQRVESLEQVVQNSYQAVDATLTDLSKTIKSGHEKMVALLEQKYQSDATALEAKLELRFREKEDELKKAYKRELAQKMDEKDQKIACQTAAMAEQEKRTAAFAKANDDCARIHKADTKKIDELQAEVKELQRQNRVAKHKLEERRYA